MKGSWPKVTASVTLRFFATHCLPKIGGTSAIPHVHEYEVIFSWTHEIRPTYGYTHEIGEQRMRFMALVDRIRERTLNDVLPLQPSAEVIALWLLAQTEPAYCDCVILRADDGYEARVDREGQRSEWMQFLAGHAPAPFPGELP